MKVEDKFKFAQNVSVVMPVRNEEDFIEACLMSVLGQTYPKDKMEILIADGMSTDNTRGVIQEVCRRENYTNVKIVENPGRIVSSGLNRLLRIASGEVIVRVDGHCEIAPDYIENCVEILEKTDVDGVGGPIETIGDTLVARVIAQAMSSKFGVGGSAFRTIKDKEMLVDTVAFPAYKKETIEKVGLLDEELVRNQDDEYNFRIRKAGGKVLLSPQIKSKYYSRASLKKLWQQYYQYGYWKVRVLQKHSRQMSIRQFVPPLFVLSLIGSILLGCFSGAILLLLFIPVLYIIANIMASIRTAAEGELRYLALLPLVFVILHLSYGMGFLVGLIKFWNRWGDQVGKVPEYEFS